MGLRCSLFGHDFGDRETERDREERGAEVVTTVRTVETCRRCGTERVVNENTEVRHIGTESGGGAKIPEPDQESDADEGAGSGDGADDTTDHEQSPAEGDEAEPETPDISQYVDSAEADGTDEDSSATAEAGTSEPGSSTSTDEPRVDPDDSEVEILDSTDEAGDSDDVDADPEEPVEGAEAGTAGSAESVEGADGPDRVAESDPADEMEFPGDPDSDDSVESEESEEPDDAIIMDNTDGEEKRKSDVGRRELAGTGNMFDPSPPEGSDGESPTEGGTPGSQGHSPDERDSETPADRPAGDDSDPGADHEPWPEDDRHVEEADDPSFQFEATWETDEDEPSRPESEGPGSGITTAGSVDVSGTSDESSPSTLACPECGYQAPIVGSSLRAGDICPECHSGYLAERQ